MPLYALIYLFLLFLYAFGSTYMHFEEKRPFKQIIAEIISYSFLLVFLVLYYEGERFSINSLIIFVMFIYTVAWEYFSFKQDVKIAKQDFGIKDRELILYTSVGVLFVLPVYFAAIALIF